MRGGQTVFDAKVPIGQYSDIQLALKGQNFIAPVTVTGSQDETGSGGYQAGTYTVFDLSGQKLGRSTVLHLPEFRFPLSAFQHQRATSSGQCHGNLCGACVDDRCEVPDYRRVVNRYAEGTYFGDRIHCACERPVDRIVFTPGASPAQFSRDVSVAVTVVAEPKAAVEGQSAQLCRIFRRFASCARHSRRPPDR